MAQSALVVILAPKVSMAILAVQVHKALRVFEAPQGLLSLVLVDRQVAPVLMDATANRVKTAEMASPACPVIEAYPAEVAVTATLAVTVGLVITVPVALQAQQVSQEQEVHLVATVREDPKVQLEQTAETAGTAGPVPMLLQAPEAPLASQVFAALRECQASRVTRVPKEPKVKKERSVLPALLASLASLDPVVVPALLAEMVLMGRMAGTVLRTPFVSLSLASSSCLSTASALAPAVIWAIPTRSFLK